jgi:glycerol-3-phosphate cytidylyltransferase
VPADRRRTAHGATRKRGQVGYTAGAFEIYTMGHLELLRGAAGRCDYLIVGVYDDELAERSLGRPPLVPMVERMAVVQSVRWVDSVVPQLTQDTYVTWCSLRFDVIFGQERQRGTQAWVAGEAGLAQVGVAVEYLSHPQDPTDEFLRQALEVRVAD